MNLEGIVSIGKNEYAITTLDKLNILSLFADPGSKVFCKEDEKVYLCMGKNEWVTI
jgi:hypothetical protein